MVSIPARLRLAGACAAGLGLVGLCWFALSGPYPLDEMCGRRRAVYVFGFFERPRFRAMTGEAFTLAVAAMSVLYLLGAWLARGLGGRRPALILLGVVPISLVAVLAVGFPLLSNDVFKYVMTGRILAVHGENPFLRVPADFPNDPFLSLVHWQDIGNAHGPIWRGFESASALAGGDQCADAILAMKVWPTLAYAATGALVYTVLRAARPEFALVGTLLYLWNPLVLLETVQNGHNDVVAALPTVGAIWLACRGRWRLAFPVLALGALVKPLAPLAGPILLVAALRAGPDARREAALGIAAALVVTLAFWAPFWAGPETLSGLERGYKFTASAAELLLMALGRSGMSDDDAIGLARNAASGLFALLYLGVLAALWLGRLTPPAAALVAFLVYLLVGAQWFNPWYLLWLVPLGALVDDRRLTAIVILFTLLAPLTYPAQYNPRLVVPLVHLPVALLAVAWLVRRGWAGRRAEPVAVPAAT